MEYVIRTYLVKMFKIVGWNLTIKTVPVATWVSCGNVRFQYVIIRWSESYVTVACRLMY